MISPHILLAGDIAPFAVLLWPLLLGLVAAAPSKSGLALRLLPLAPLPALGFAIAGAPGAALLPDLVLGTLLEAHTGGALFIGMTAMVWTVAGLHVALTFESDSKNAMFAAFWCLTLAGNLGVFLAQDIASFYVAFAAVSLAAWFLVVHDRTPEALHAGRIYIILAIIGEASLLAGLLIGALAADSFAIADVRSALAGAPLGGLAAGLLIAGFGIKAGMVPLHIWLPLAHPAAPVPGSAVLSGAIVKAGLIGVLAFIPAGGFPLLEDTVLTLGLIGAFGAALWGLTQTNPKAVLAYSTISQMGLMLALSMTAAASAMPFYALHHGLAKGALFLLVGVFLAADSARQRGLVLVVMATIGLSVAGFPFTGGAIVKAAAKAETPAWLALAVSASGVTTSAVLGWLLVLLAAKPSKPASERRFWPILLAGPVMLGLAAWALPHALAPIIGAPDWAYFTKAAALAEAGLPVLAGAIIAAVLMRKPLPKAPTGDVIALMPAISRPRFKSLAAIWHNAAHSIQRLLLTASRRGAKAAVNGEAALLRWPFAGALLTATTLLLAWSLAAA